MELLDPGMMLYGRVFFNVILENNNVGIWNFMLWKLCCEQGSNILYISFVEKRRGSNERDRGDDERNGVLHGCRAAIYHRGSKKESYYSLSTRGRDGNPKGIE